MTSFDMKLIPLGCLALPKSVRAIFLTYETELVLFLAVLENSVLPMN